MSTATAPVFASAGEAMAMVHAGLAYVVTADAAAMSAAERARCLRELEEADAVATAARTSVLGVFAARQDYADDGDYSPCAWLMHRTRVTKGTAMGHTVGEAGGGASGGDGGAGRPAGLDVVCPGDLLVDRQAPGGVARGGG